MAESAIRATRRRWGARISGLGVLALALLCISPDESMPQALPTMPDLVREAKEARVQKDFFERREKSSEEMLKEYDKDPFALFENEERLRRTLTDWRRRFQQLNVEFAKALAEARGMEFRPPSAPTVGEWASYKNFIEDMSPKDRAFRITYYGEKSFRLMEIMSKMAAKVYGLDEREHEGLAKWIFDEPK